MRIPRLLVAPALLASCAPDWNALDPSLGSAATTTVTTTTGTGGSGQTTTTTQACSSPTECPGSDSTCATRTCTGGACGVDYTPSGTHCGGSSSSKKCDGMGNCI